MQRLDSLIVAVTEELWRLGPRNRVAGQQRWENGESQRRSRAVTIAAALLEDPPC